jgi:hypothetical protein
MPPTEINAKIGHESMKKLCFLLRKQSSIHIRLFINKYMHIVNRTSGIYSFLNGNDDTQVSLTVDDDRGCTS